MSRHDPHESFLHHLAAASPALGLALVTAACSAPTAPTDRAAPAVVVAADPAALRRAAPARAPVARTQAVAALAARTALALRVTRSLVVRARVVAQARTALGTPYRYGGTTTRGFDCSGLSSWTYRREGFRLPRVADAQMRSLRATTHPRPGDLVFFLAGGHAYHVGVYLGRGRMISSPHSGTVVKIQSIWSRRVAYRSLPV